MITKRVIHTSADFDYIQTLKYSKDAVAIAKRLISEGADIVTDTNMALSGINKKYLAKFGGQAHCFMADDEVALIAKEKKTTRAAVSMEFASRIDKPVIFAIGNAPTALIELYDMIEKGIYKPAFVIGGLCQCGGSQGAYYGDRRAIHSKCRTKGWQQYCSCHMQCADLQSG